MTFAESAGRAWHFAAQLLGWRPKDFWSATPRELAEALQAPAEICEPPSAAAIAALRQRFPD